MTIVLVLCCSILVVHSYVHFECNLDSLVVLVVFIVEILLWWLLLCIVKDMLIYSVTMQWSHVGLKLMLLICIWQCSQGKVICFCVLLRACWFFEGHCSGHRLVVASVHCKARAHFVFDIVAITGFQEMNVFGSCTLSCATWMDSHLVCSLGSVHRGISCCLLLCIVKGVLIGWRTFQRSQIECGVFFCVL